MQLPKMIDAITQVVDLGVADDVLDMPLNLWVRSDGSVHGKDHSEPGGTCSEATMTLAQAVKANPCKCLRFGSDPQIAPIAVACQIAMSVFGQMSGYNADKNSAKWARKYQESLKTATRTLRDGTGPVADNALAGTLMDKMMPATETKYQEIKQNLTDNWVNTPLATQAALLVTISNQSEGPGGRLLELLPQNSQWEINRYLLPGLGLASIEDYKGKPLKWDPSGIRSIINSVRMEDLNLTNVPTPKGGILLGEGQSLQGYLFDLWKTEINDACDNLGKAIDEWLNTRWPDKQYPLMTFDPKRGNMDRYGAATWMNGVGLISGEIIDTLEVIQEERALKTAPEPIAMLLAPDARYRCPAVDDKLLMVLEGIWESQEKEKDISLEECAKVASDVMGTSESQAPSLNVRTVKLNAPRRNPHEADQGPSR